MVKNLILTVLLALALTVAGQNPKDAACRSLVKCLSEVEETRVQCDKLRKASVNNQKKPASSDECSTIGAKTEGLQGLLTQQRQQQRECLSNSFADATPVGDKNKQEQCRKAVASYQQQGNEDSRPKRQANGNATASTTTPHSTNVSATTSNSSSIASSTNGSTPVGVGGSKPHDTKPEGNGNGTSEDRAATTAQLKKCYQNAETKQRACRELYSCCSEVTPCDFKFHLSPLHSEIYQSQLDLFYLRRRCQQQQLQKGKPAAANNANATAAASVKGSNRSKKSKGNQ